MQDDLYTVRDFFRFAVSEFTRANLHFGHGATNAVDEAAFIVLEALALPIDDVNPWLDARLTFSERRRLSELIETRVATRRPAAYLLTKAYVQGAPFYVDERVIVPRSYLGELLAQDSLIGPDRDGAGLLTDPSRVLSALELCTGSGCLAILAAQVFPNAEFHATDISPDALDVARRNVADYGLDDRIALHLGDLFAPVRGRVFDLILANPPYVDDEAMARLPAEYRAEPEMALAGGSDGLDIVRRILEEAPGFLKPGGGLLCEIGAGREILEIDYPDLNFLWLDSAESRSEVFWLAASDWTLAE